MDHLKNNFKNIEITEDGTIKSVISRTPRVRTLIITTKRIDEDQNEAIIT